MYKQKKTLRILDIGACIGEVLSVFNDNGNICEAIEVNPSAIDHLKSIGINVFEDSFYNYKSNEKFDIIMAWGVIEHVTNPSLFLLEDQRTDGSYNPNARYISKPARRLTSGESFANLPSGISRY